MTKLIKNEKIEEFRKEKGLSKKEFCRECGVGLNTYNKIISNKYNFRIVALFKISRFMKVHISDLCENEKLTVEDLEELRMMNKNKRVKKSD